MSSQSVWICKVSHSKSHTDRMRIIVYILFYFELFISLGSIDEVNQVVHISWVQPRVLDHKQVNISVKVPLWPLVILRICNLWIPLREIVIYRVRRKFYLCGLFLHRKLHRKELQPQDRLQKHSLAIVYYNQWLNGFP